MTKQIDSENVMKLRIQKLLSSKLLSKVKAGITLLKESDNPELNEFFSQGLDIDTHLRVAKSSEVFKHVKPEHRTYVALCILNQCNQLQNVSKLSLKFEAIISLDGLRGCISLKKLDLAGCESLIDLDALKECPKLGSLDLLYCSTLSPVMRKKFKTRSEVKRVLSMWESVWKPSYKELLTPLTIGSLSGKDVEHLEDFQHPNPDIQVLQRARYIAITKRRYSQYFTQLKKILKIKKIHPDVASFIEASMSIKQMNTLTGLNGFAECIPRGLVKNGQILRGFPPHLYNEDDYFPVLWLSSDVFVAIETGRVVCLHHDATFNEVLSEILLAKPNNKEIANLVDSLAYYGSEIDLRQLVAFESLCVQTCKKWPSVSSTEQKKVFSNLYKIHIRNRADLKKSIACSYGYEFLYNSIREYIDGD